MSATGNKPRILLITNSAWNLYNFRLPIARALQARGFEPVMVAPRDDYVERLQESGFRWIELKLSRRGINPFAELRTVLELIRIIKEEKPAAIHNFTVKCVIYGTVAGRAAGVRGIMNTITGMGTVFTGGGLKMRLLRPLVRALYRRALNHDRVRNIFQNPDDLNTFVLLRMAAPTRSVLVRGSGVDTERFKPPAPSANGVRPVFLFASRLLVDKGIVEFVEAARSVHARNSEVVFQIAGRIDPGNPSSISQETLEEWKRSGLADFKGYVEDIETLIASATAVVLPSYREGVPRVLLEAAAMAKPIVATDVPGCREVVENEKNGLLVPARDSSALANAIERLAREPGLCRALGQAGREKVLREFNEETIIPQIMKVYEAVL